VNDEEIVQAYGEGISILIKDDGTNSEETKNCQSCGMLLKTNEYLGKEKDGSLNKDFCKYCYDKGELVEMTMDDMINYCAPTVAEYESIDLEEAKKLMGEFFPRLKRWR
jgi:hypothetical protein